MHNVQISASVNPVVISWLAEELEHEIPEVDINGSEKRLLDFACTDLEIYLETKMLIDSNFDPVIISKADQSYQIGRLFTTLGHIGLFMLFIKSGILRFLQKSLAAVGKLALTNYLTHSVVTSIIFYGDGFALFGELERYELYYIVAAIWIMQLIFSPIWLKYFLYGPAEWVWRSLTYQQKQPFRIT